MPIRVKASQLTSRVAGTQSRYSTNANPVAEQPTVADVTTTLTTVNPRVQHPKLNTKPWSVSYAQRRKPLSERKARKMPKG